MTRRSMRSLEAQLRAVYGRRWPVFLLWYAEACLAASALWSLSRGSSPLVALSSFAFLMACGVALAIPCHVLRLAMLVAGASPRLRRVAMQLLLAVSASATAAALSTERGWAAIICILLVGDALWALDLELRAS
jgi:hypothetical protein